MHVDLKSNYPRPMCALYAHKMDSSQKIYSSLGELKRILVCIVLPLFLIVPQIIRVTE